MPPARSWRRRWRSASASAPSWPLDRLSRDVPRSWTEGSISSPATTRTPTSSPVTNSIQWPLRSLDPVMLLLGCCQPTSVLRKEVRHLLWLRIASGKAAVVPARPFLHFNVAIYAARSVASFLDKPISGIFGCGSSRNRAIFAASNPGIFAITGNGGAWSVVVLVLTGVTT